MKDIDAAVQSHQDKIVKEIDENEERAEQLTHEIELIQGIKECAALENVMNFPEITPVNTVKIKGMAVYSETKDSKPQAKLVAGFNIAEIKADAAKKLNQPLEDVILIL